MSEESSIRRRIDSREHSRPGGTDPALETPWANPKYWHPGHRWHLAPAARNVWIGSQPQHAGLRLLLRRIFGRRYRPPD